MRNLLLFAFGVYFGMGLYLYLVQRNFIYFPVPELQTGLPAKIYENQGEKIKVFTLNQGKGQALIYFGGNAENVAYNVDEFSRLFPEYAIYLVNYRGYGGSTGEATEKGIYSDAIYIYDQIKDRHQGISVVGRSLGTAIATYVASNREVQKLVLVTPFDSIESIAKSQYPIFPVSILLKDKHDSYSRAKNILADTLVIAASTDRIISMSHTERLIEGFEIDVKFEVIDGAGHNDLSEYSQYTELLERFL